MIAEASAEDNREIVGYATDDSRTHRAGKVLIESSPMARLTLCRSVSFQVSFTLQRRLGIQHMERSGSLARRSDSVAHLMIAICWCVCVLLYSCNYSEEAS